MDPNLRARAEAAPGFMPGDEGEALYAAACAAPALPFLEIGSYCGKSAVYLGAAARSRDIVVYSVDHHRGSEEQQPGEEFHDPRTADAAGRVDTLPLFLETLAGAALDDVVVPLVGDSPAIADAWATPLGLLFVDGGHSHDAAHGDYESWAPHLVSDGLLAVHDVFEDPSEGGRPPLEIYTRALDSGAFAPFAERGSLRVLKRVADGI